MQQFPWGKKGQISAGQILLLQFKLIPLLTHSGSDNKTTGCAVLFWLNHNPWFIIMPGLLCTGLREHFYLKSRSTQWIKPPQAGEKPVFIFTSAHAQ